MELVERDDLAVAQPDGQSNIFLTQFSKRQRAVAGDDRRRTLPRFSRDGRELFYLAGSRDAGGRAAAWAFQRRTGDAPPYGEARRAGDPVLTMRRLGQPGPSLGWFDVVRDGRFLMSRVVTPAAGDARRLILVQNWIGAMGK